ncbi:cytochrome P450, partial [Erythrobacter sp. YJ-T3-07]|uniref:cytochrome P450 n=1 Tax=Erythrobacter sp. YJ-T3-07 TaxID=2793063 RepID=UPI0034D2C26C
MLLAGRDTTAGTLSWAIYELARHPQVVEKLRTEIIGRIGPTNTPTFEDLNSMHYLQNVLNETMRLYPTLPFNIRFALKDCTLPCGGGADGSLAVPVLKGTLVAYSTLAMQRRADLYPTVSSSFAPVDEFDPDRWNH